MLRTLYRMISVYACSIKINLKDDIHNIHTQTDKLRVNFKFTIVITSTSPVFQTHKFCTNKSVCMLVGVADGGYISLSLGQRHRKFKKIYN